MNTLTLNKVLLNARPLNMRRRVVKDKDFIYKVLDREFTFSKTAGGKSIKSSTATIVKLKGNSVVWNQMVSDTMYLSASKYEGQVVGGKYVGKNKEAVLAQNSGIIVRDYYTIIGHKYLWIFTCSDANCRASVGDKYGLNSGVITEATSVGRLNIYPYGASNKTIEAGTEFELTAQVHDLTQMFQAGNEPTTIEEFNARKPIVEDEYAYNEGEVIHMTAESIKSVGDNAWDEEWESGTVNINTGSLSANRNAIRNANPIKVLQNQSYSVIAPSDLHVLFYGSNNNYLGWKNQANINGFTTPVNVSYIRFYCPSTTTYNNDIMITLVHSGWKQDTDAGYQPYWEDRLMFDQRIKDEFPNGMSKWDMVYNKNGKGYIVHGLGVEDMGDMAWSYDSANQVFTSYTIMDLMAHPTEVSERNKGLLCSKYNPSTTYVASTMDDKSWLRIPKSVTIKDTAYTDAASFKAAMAGVPLYYELAEPTIIEYDEPFNLDYRVADFGTEQAIAETNSAPISAEIGYHILKNNLELTLNT